MNRTIISAIGSAILALSLFGGCAGGPKPTSAAVGKEPSAEQKRIQAVQSAETLLAKGDATAAADQLGLLAAASPADSDLKLAQAAALVSAGKLADARTTVDSILATEPANPRALTMGAQLARFGGDDKARRSYLDRALAAAPADAAVLVAWGDLYLDAKDWPKADDFYRRALASDPKSSDASLGLGRALYREAKYPESEASLTAAIALEPASPSPTPIGAARDTSKGNTRKQKPTSTRRYRRPRMNLRSTWTEAASASPRATSSTPGRTWTRPSPSTPAISFLTSTAEASSKKRGRIRPL